MSDDSPDLVIQEAPLVCDADIFIRISELEVLSNNIIDTLSVNEITFDIKKELVFTMGIFNPCRSIKSKRRRLLPKIKIEEEPKKRKRKLSSGNNNKRRRGLLPQQQEQEQEQQEQHLPAQQQQTNDQKKAQEIYDIINLFPTENPFYVTSKAHALVHLHKPPSFDKKFSGQIKIIKPLTPIRTIENIFAYRALINHSGSLFAWQVKLGQMDITGELFKLPKSRLKYRKQIYNTNIYNEAEAIFERNQWLRWQFKRILNAWLTKKSHKRIIGADCDLISGDPVLPQEQIKIISLKTRTVYVFSGHVLLKNTKTCLENQVGAIPTVKPPNNPFTNTAFTYGEIIEVHNQILAWCAKKGHAFPAILALYRDYKFKAYLLSRLNNNYLQLKAAETFILNDDINGDFFAEAMEALLEEYDDLLNVEFDTIIVSQQRFRFWNRIEPKHHLLITWKKFAAHFWYYKQTDQAPRENWHSYSSIYVDLVILIRASIPKLENLYKEFYRGVIIIDPANDML